MVSGGERVADRGLATQLKHMVFEKTSREVLQSPVVFLSGVDYCTHI